MALKRSRAFALLVGLSLITGLGYSQFGGSANTGTGDPHARELVNQKCTACHGMSSVTGTAKYYEDWEDTRFRMQEYAQGKPSSFTEDEAYAMIDYLTDNYGVK
ncbi:MAG TPA: hypothetical protein HA257_08185 [Candidatus Methanoperedenaceae archaeon]|nr:hypothetical protein [Candidatus Methanoperedenaceae archaeon]